MPRKLSIVAVSLIDLKDFFGACALNIRYLIVSLEGFGRHVEIIPGTVANSISLGKSNAENHHNQVIDYTF